MSGRVLLLQHKIIEIIRNQPRSFSEYLFNEYEYKMKDKYNEFIFRQVFPTSNFAILPEHRGEDYQNTARVRR